MTLRDCDDLLEARVRATIDALELTVADTAARALAVKYARLIDESVAHEDPKIGAWAIRWVGPLLLEVLGELGATPASRAQISKGKKDAPAVASGLAQLRAARK